VRRDAPPAEYVPEVRKRFSDQVGREMQRQHALPDGWEGMPYQVFLEERRKLMAAVIRAGYEALG